MSLARSISRLESQSQACHGRPKVLLVMRYFFFLFLLRRINPCLKPLVTQSEKVVNFTYRLLIKCESKIRSRKARPPTLFCFSWLVDKSASASSVRQIAQQLDGRLRLNCLLIIQYIQVSSNNGPLSHPFDFLSSTPYGPSTRHVVDRPIE